MKVDLFKSRVLEFLGESGFLLVECPSDAVGVVFAKYVLVDFW